MSEQPEALLELAVQAAMQAGELLRQRFEAGTERALASKSTPTDLVSQADLAAQEAIRALLARERPNDGFLGEEAEGDSEGAAGSSGLRWIVDPLDGTVNFLFGIPQWCVSVAVEDAHGTLAGAIYDPLRGELFTSLRDGAATLNGTSIRASQATQLDQAMVATGFAYDANIRDAQGQVLAALISRVRDVRRFGAAALDLAWCAAGRYDAYFERTVKPWDIAAGVLLCRSAGMEIRELEASERLPYGILVAPPAIAGELHALVARA